MNIDIPTPEQVEAIRQRRVGPWHGLDEYGVIARQDADITTLLAAYDALTAEVQRLRDALAPDGSLERLANTYTAEGTVIVLRRMGRLRDERDEARARAAAAERKVAAVRALVVDRDRRVVLSQRTRYGEHTDYSNPLVRVTDIRAVLDGED